jgi:hypothetical protein
LSAFSPPLCARGERDDLARISQEQPAGRRQLDVPAIAKEQRHSDARLERLDLLRQRRRGDVQSLRRAPEMQLLGHATKYRSTAIGAASRDPVVPPYEAASISVTSKIVAVLALAEDHRTA